MRLVTWSVDHGSGGRHRPDDFLTALEALGPDILVLVDRGTGALLKPLREAVAGIGLVHQLAPDAATPHRPLLIASRLELVRGSLPGGGDAASAPPNALHVYAPGGILDVLSLKVARQGQRPTSGRNGWRWLLDAAARLKHRRTILIGDFAASAGGDDTGGHQALRRFTDDGWQHAVPPEGAAAMMMNGHAAGIDHAFLSPSVQRVDVRYALEAAGLRLAGAKEALAERPALVVDLQ